MARMIKGVAGLHETFAAAAGAASNSILNFVTMQGGATVHASNVPAGAFVSGISGELMSVADSISKSQ